MLTVTQAKYFLFTNREEELGYIVIHYAEKVCCCFFQKPKNIKNIKARYWINETNRIFQYPKNSSNGKVSLCCGAATGQYLQFKENKRLT